MAVSGNTLRHYNINMPNINIINLSWEKIIYSEAEIQKLSNPHDAGLYQIYGYHPAYGNDSLLYIGQASTFSERLKGRFEFSESCAIPDSIRIGRICNAVEKENIFNWDLNKREELISIAEKMLIKSHAPAFNKIDNTGLFSETLKEFDKIDYIILNWGEFGKLLPEISTFRYSYRFYMFETPLGFQE